MNWYKTYKQAKLTKQGSMTLHVKGFPYSEFPEMKMMGDYANNVIYTFGAYVESILSPEELALWNLERQGYFVTPDGNDYLEITGVMNFYLSGIPENKIGILINRLIELFESINLKVGKPLIDTWSDFYNANSEHYNQEFNLSNYDDAGYDSQEEYAKSIQNLQDDRDSILQKGNAPRVARIPILDNNNGPVDRPPEVNMAQANTYFIFNKTLGYNGDLEGKSFDANELSSRIKYYLGETGFNTVPEHQQEQYNKDLQEAFFGGGEKNTDEIARMFSGKDGISSYDNEDIRYRLQHILDFCQWTLNHGYNVIYLG